MAIDRALRPRRQADRRRCSCSAAPPSASPSCPAIASIGVAGDRGCWRCARIGQGLALGGAWDGLASLLALNAPREPARLVRDDAAARRAARASSSRAALFAYLRRQPVEPTTSSTGAGAIRSSSPSPSTSWRCSRGCAWWRRTNTSALFETRELEPVARVARLLRAQGRNILHRRLRAAGQLRAVPPGHGVPAVLGDPVHPRAARCRLPDHRDRRRRVRRRRRSSPRACIADRFGRAPLLGDLAVADRDLQRLRPAAARRRRARRGRSSC